MRLIYSHYPSTWLPLPLPPSISISLSLRHLRLNPQKPCFLSNQSRRIRRSFHRFSSFVSPQSQSVGDRSGWRGSDHRHLGDTSVRRREDKGNDKDDFYALLLESSIPTFSSARTTSNFSTAGAATAGIVVRDSISAGAIASDLPKASLQPKSVPAPTEPLVIFGSRLAGPAARNREGWGDSRPPEPDNCCMSGCVNCVWDAYREEVEEWAARQRQGQIERQEKEHLGGEEAGRQRKIGSRSGGDVGDLDGMGGDNLDADDFFKDLPVGIKEFIATEKRLKERESMQSGSWPR